MTRRARILFVLWLMLVLLGSAVHAAAWIGHAPGLVRTLSNLNTTINLPVYIPFLAFFGHRGFANPLVIVAYNAVGYSCWFLVIWGLVSLRNRIVILFHKDRHSLAPEFPGAPSKSESEPGLSRRAFLSTAAVAVPAASVPVGCVYAAAVEPAALRTRRLTVPIADLPSELDGLTLVQISDTHLGPRVSASSVEHAIQTALALKPDLFCLTGDYVGGNGTEIDRAVSQFKPLFDAAPTVAVLGNHDWWADAPAFKKAFNAIGIPCIDNDRCFLSLNRTLTRDPDPAGLAIVGLGDLIGDVTDTGRAFRGVDPSQPVLLLAHEPDTAELSVLTGPAAPRVDLMLAGHTHGGQIRVPFLGTPAIPSEYGQKYAAGLVAGPRFPVHVSTGVGLSMLPIRIGVPPEINHITLIRG